MKHNNQSLGWIVFKMDMDLLDKVFKLDQEDLKEFVFQEP